MEVRRITELTRRLERAKTFYQLQFPRRLDRTEISVPGECWEVELLEDGTVEVERLVMTGSIGDESLLEELFARYSDDDR
jgi:hypothetical protein